MFLPSLYGCALVSELTLHVMLVLYVCSVDQRQSDNFNLVVDRRGRAPEP